METTHDVIIIGAGPAGLSAAHMLGRSRRRVLVIDAGEPRNRFAPHMHGVLGVDGLSPAELAAKAREELAPYDVTFVEGRVEEVTATDDLVTARTDGDSYTARALVVATGASDELPAIQGLAEHWGSRVLHCPYCHGWEVRDQRLAVIVTSAAALHQVQLVRQLSDSVMVFTATVEPLDDETRNQFVSRGMTINDSPVTLVTQDDDGALLVHTSDRSTTGVDAIFLASTLHPQDDFLPAEIHREDSGHGAFLRVEGPGRTNLPRVWATGNVVDVYANVPMCIGAGSATGGAVNAALVEEDVEAALRT